MGGGVCDLSGRKVDRIRITESLAIAELSFAGIKLSLLRAARVKPKIYLFTNSLARLSLRLQPLY